MSRLIQHEQYTVLLALRDCISRAVATGDHIEAASATGRMQGYLIGLHAACEIEKGDVEALEADMMGGVAFLINARKAGKHHA